MKSAENCTYFQSSGAETGNCVAKICKCDEKVCQLRLDFSTFVINQPSTDTLSVSKVLNGEPSAGAGIPVTTVGQCITDRFYATSPGNQAPPIICGTNTGEHSK